jgi:zinc/manganese transport system permease protein
MSLHDLLIAPFTEFAFMRRALIACFAISLSAGPIGAFMLLRRMSLMGDAMSHAVLPGVALGFLLFGLDLWPMAFGGLVASLAVALLAGLVSRLTAERRCEPCRFLPDLALGRHADRFLARQQYRSAAYPVRLHSRRR